MADDLKLVKPGQLITADLLNSIITRVLGIDTQDGRVEVPSVFGRTLSDAVQLLQTPGGNLQLGSVLDVFGAVIAPSDPTKVGLRVIGQSPSPGTRVQSGAGVNLVISAATPGSTPSTAPRIDGFAPVPQAVGMILQIIGANFDANRLNNQVTINNQSAGAPGANSTANSLFVVVPPGAQGTGVLVRVTLPDGRFATGQTNITAATGALLPQITGINGITTGTAVVALGSTVTISGTNFGTSVAQATVSLGTPGASVPALVPSAVTNTSLTVTIPASVAAAFRNSTPVITVNNVVGPASPVVLSIV